MNKEVANNSTGQGLTQETVKHHLLLTPGNSTCAYDNTVTRWTAGDETAVTADEMVTVHGEYARFLHVTLLADDL